MTNLFVGFVRASLSDAPPPPADITRDSYLAWLATAGSAVSAFSPTAFDWYAAQQSAPLPSQVDNDPDRIFAAVDRAISETDALEASGDIDTGNTIGFDAYGLADASLANTLETSLFFCGKPVGKTEGTTHPFDTVFASSRCSIQPRWGEGNCFSQQSYTGGGIVFDLNDDFTVLVRGSASQGFSVFYSFFGQTENKSTATQAHISIMMFKARSATTTEFRHRFRRNGQSYAILGPNGRRMFGFNVTRIRQGVKVFTSAAKELQQTGKIKERS